MNHKKLFYRGIKSLKNSLGRLGFVMGIGLLQIGTCAHAQEAVRNPGTIDPFAATQREIAAKQIKALKKVADDIAKFEADLSRANAQLTAEEAKPTEDQNKGAIENLKKRIQEATKALDEKNPDPPEGYEGNKGLRDQKKALEKQIPESTAQAGELERLSQELRDKKANLQEAEQATMAPNQQDDSAYDELHAAAQAHEQAQLEYGKAANALDKNGNGVHDLADTQRAFEANKPGIPVGESPAQTPSQTQSTPFEPRSLTGENTTLSDMAAVSEGRAAPGPGTQAKMDEMASRANDTSLSKEITGRSNGGYQSNEGTAFVNGEPVKGRYFDDIHGGGRYFVPDSAYGNRGLDGYMANRATDLSGLHQLNGKIASGNATRVGNNIQFDGFYNGTQVFRNGMWNAPANGSLASRASVPFSSSNQVAARQAPAVTSSVNTSATGARTTASASVIPPFSFTSPSTWLPSLSNWFFK